MTKPKAPRGPGRKPLDPSGEVMKIKPVRMTEQDWEDFKLVTAEAVREWVRKQARAMRKKGLK